MVLGPGSANDKAAFPIAQVKGRTSSIKAVPNSSARDAREAESTEGLDSRSRSVLKETKGEDVLVQWELGHSVDVCGIVVDEGEELDDAGLGGIGGSEVRSTDLAGGGVGDVEDEVAVVVADGGFGVDGVDGGVLNAEWGGVVLGGGEGSGGSEGGKEGSKEDLGELHLGNYSG